MGKILLGAMFLLPMTLLVTFANVAGFSDDKMVNDVKSLYCELNKGEWFYIQEGLHQNCHFNVGLFDQRVRNILLEHLYRIVINSDKHFCCSIVFPEHLLHRLNT